MLPGQPFVFTLVPNFVGREGAGLLRPHWVTISPAEFMPPTATTPSPVPAEGGEIPSQKRQHLVAPCTFFRITNLPENRLPQQRADLRSTQKSPHGGDLENGHPTLIQGIESLSNQTKFVNCPA